MSPLQFDTEEAARAYLRLSSDPDAANLDLTEAYDALDRAEQDNDERKVLWRMLAAYELNPTYENFCEKLGLEPSRKESRDLFDLSRTSFVAAKKRYGQERLDLMCRIGWNGLFLHDWRLL